MPFDGITIHAICNELSAILNGGRIDKIHQPEKDELLLTIHQPKIGSYKLLISANARWARIQFQDAKVNNPITPPSFCMLLRKYLEGAKIISIRQLGLERIVHINFEALNDFREWQSITLICEFMGKHSNIILVNPETGIIIDAIKKYSHELSSFREVLPGREYLQPPAQGKITFKDISIDDFCALLWKDETKSLSQACFLSFEGFSPFAAKQICLQAGLDPAMSVALCGLFEFTQLHQFIQKLLNSVESVEVESSLLLTRKGAQDFAPYAIIDDHGSSYTETYPTILKTCSLYFNQSLHRFRLESFQANIIRRIKDLLERSYRKKLFQSGDLEHALQNKKYRTWGELLTAFSTLSKKGDQEIILNDFYDDEPITIILDPLLTPIQNAQKFFKIYNKSTKTIKSLETLMQQNQENIDYLESTIVAVEQSESIQQIEEIVLELENEQFFKKKGKNKGSKTTTISNPRRFMSSDGFEILVGRNNRQNDVLTLKTAGKMDLWLHTKDIPGTHVIIKTPNTCQNIDDIPIRTLEEASALAAYFSKAQQADKVAVDYTFRKHVQKPKNSRPGMVIYENYWTIMAKPRINDLSELN